MGKKQMASKGKGKDIAPPSPSLSESEDVLGHSPPRTSTADISIQEPCAQTEKWSKFRNEPVLEQPWKKLPTRSTRKKPVAVPPEPTPSEGNPKDSSTFQRQHLHDDEAWVRFLETFSIKKILPGLAIDFESALDRQNDLRVIREIVEFQGWLKVLTETYPIHDHLVRYFYANMVVITPYQKLKTWVKGKEIVITPRVLANCLEVPETGIYNDQQRKWPSRAPFTFEEALEGVFGDKQADAIQNWSTIHLSLPLRLLHVIVTHFIEPRSGTFAKVTMRDLFLLHAMISME
ncbi:hypothetical protein Ancab_021978 [Ancistrocladus abbreviatus]